MKTVLLLLDIGSYSTELSISGLSYYKLVKDLVEKISKNSSFLTRFILLIFSTRYFNYNLVSIFTRFASSRFSAKRVKWRIRLNRTVSYNRSTDVMNVKQLNTIVSFSIRW